MKTVNAIAIGVIAGAVMTALTYSILPSSNDSHDSEADAGEKQPLYWVAPMDPNYRRDEPGKSPMGMDLVPVYEDEQGAGDSPGTVKISPTVVNNLGVRTAKVEKRSLHVPIKTVGYIQYNEDTLVHIHPRVEGWIDELYVKAAGEYVKKGEPLYALYSPELVNAQEEYLIALKRSNRELIEASKTRLKALQMPESGIQSLISTGKVQQTITFYAPQTGFVDNLNVRQGFYVKPGLTILSIGALDKVWVDAEVFERQSAQIQEGLPVTMTLEYLPGKEWTGEVDYIYPTLDETTRTLKVRLRFTNDDYALKPNMFAQVTIHSDLTGENLLVPSEAVIRTGSQDRVVLALGDGKFKSVSVEVGQVVDEYSEILSGLRLNDKIVTSAQFLLDSESSISSDFKRMEEPEATAQSVYTEATVNSVMTDHRMINVDHGAIEEWEWPSMTMDFTVAESVDINELKAGMSLHMEITKTDSGSFEVTTVHIMDSMNDMDSSEESTDSGHDAMHSMEEPIMSVWTEATINNVMMESRKINVDHGPIDEWEWPSMTMDFDVADSVAIEELKAGMSLHMEIVKTDSGSFEVATVHIMGSMTDMNHTQDMDHSNHSDHQGAHQ
jgi:Cu(I)/Ag(I) efflux system membrane fusion protein